MAATAGRDVRFTATVTPPDATALGDRDRLAQVVVNLLDNAARHSPPGGEVRVNARSDQGGLVIGVRDDGPGIAPEDKDKLFVPTFSTKRRGSGLGLAIVNRIVQEHQGTIRVEDNLPHGARFVVELPA